MHQHTHTARGSQYTGPHCPQAAPPERRAATIMQRLGAWLVALAIVLTPSLSAAEGGMEMLGLGDLTQEEPKHDEASKEPSIRLFPDKLEWPQHDSDLSEDSWQTFFKRQPLGFDAMTIQTLPDRVWELGGPLWGKWGSDPWDAILWSLAPILALLGLVILFLFLEMRFKHLSKDFEEKLSAWLPDWLKRLGLSAGKILGLIWPVIVFQVLVYIGVAFFRAEESHWAQVLTDSIWLFLAYRVALGLVRELLGSSVWLDIEPDSVRRLKLFVIWILRVALVFQAALIVVRTFKVGQDVEALIWFCFQVLLLVISVFLIGLKREIFMLLPQPAGEPIWGPIHARINRHYRTVLAVTLGLQAMWLIGYVQAASFLLSRGYAMLTLVAILAGVQGRVAAWLTPRIATAESEEQRETLIRTNRGLRFALVLCFMFGGLLTLGLWPYVRVLLRYRLLRIGGADLSLYLIGAAACIFGIFLLVSRILRTQLMDRVYPRIGLEVGVGYAINTIAHYALVVIGVLTALATLGVDLGALTLFATAFSVGIGFGLQDMTRNLVSGFILLIGRSVKKGDFVNVDNHFGRVEALGARSVQIVTPDNTEIVIPSSRLVNETIINFTYSNPRIRLHIPVGVHYGSDVRHVEQALLNAATRHTAVLRTPRPSVRLNDFGDSAINFELLIWIDVRRIDPARVRGELHFHIWDIFKEQGIEIPYPQRDLNLRGGAFVEDLVRALHNQPRAQHTTPPQPPDLTPMESYLRRHDNRPRIFNNDTDNAVLDTFRFQSFLAQREDALQRLGADFLNEHHERLHTLSTNLNTQLKQHPVPESGPLARLG